MSGNPVQHTSFCHSCESRNPGFPYVLLDPRLLASLKLRRSGRGDDKKGSFVIQGSQISTPKAGVYQAEMLRLMSPWLLLEALRRNQKFHLLCLFHPSCLMLPPMREVKTSLLRKTPIPLQARQM